MMEKAENGILSGDDAFRLQDTYGFPIDLTKEIANERNITVDEERFRQLVEEARLKAKSAKRNAADSDWRNSGVSFKDIAKTEFTGYTENGTEGIVLALVSDGERKDFINDGDSAIVVLDKTSFYAESGGQTGDVGVIRIGESVFEVTNTTKDPDGAYLHHGTLTGDGIKVGDAAVTVYDEASRASTRRNHTAAHLLQAALREILGSHVEQAGQLVNDTAMRFDFTHFSALTSEELEKVENRVNEVILSALPVTSTEMPIEEAKKAGAMALFGEKYGDIVRVVKAGDFSTELCGGTHVDNSGKLGLFKIISESSVAAGVRRIEAVTGFGVLEYIAKNNALINATAATMKLANVSDLDKKANALMNDLKAKDKEIEQLRAELSQLKTGDLMSNAVDVNGICLVTTTVEGVNPGDLRSMCDKVKENENAVAVICGINGASANFACACGKEAVAKGAHAGNIVREVSKLAGGSGGGRPDSAMAGTKDVSNIGAAMEAVSGILKGMLK